MPTLCDLFIGKDPGIRFFHITNYQFVIIVINHGSSLQSDESENRIFSIYTERSYIEQLARQNTQPQFSLQKIRICDRNQSNHHPSVL